MGDVNTSSSLSGGKSSKHRFQRMRKKLRIDPGEGGYSVSLRSGGNEVPCSGVDHRTPLDRLTGVVINFHPVFFVSGVVLTTLLLMTIFNQALVCERMAMITGFWFLLRAVVINITRVDVGYEHDGLPWPLLQKALDFEKFSKSDLIGRGASGKVYKINVGDIDHAFKVVMNGPAMKVSIKHPNIIHYLGCVRFSTGVVVEVMELGGESLDNYLRRKETLTLSSFCTLTKNLLAAVEYMHKQRVVHRDIKPGNITLTMKNGELDMCQLIDLSLAVVSPTWAGTILAMSPEYLTCSLEGKMFDIYQGNDMNGVFLVMAAVLLGGKTPMTRKNPLAGLFDCIDSSELNKDFLAEMPELLMGLRRGTVPERDVGHTIDAIISVSRQLLERDGEKHGIYSADSLTDLL